MEKVDLGISEERLLKIKERWSERLGEIISRQQIEGGYTVEIIMEEVSKLLSEEEDLPQKARDWIMLKTGQSVERIFKIRD